MELAATDSVAGGVQVVEARGRVTSAMLLPAPLLLLWLLLAVAAETRADCSAAAAAECDGDDCGWLYVCTGCEGEAAICSCCSACGRGAVEVDGRGSGFSATGAVRGCPLLLAALLPPLPLLPWLSAKCRGLIPPGESVCDRAAADVGVGYWCGVTAAGYCCCSCGCNCGCC